jgi:tetratricopeptide (TPR) repeat protein
MAEINAVIASDPENVDNSQYYYIRGSLYEQLKKNDSAKLSYTKALELNPDNYDANWNLGALLVNEANDLYKTIGIGGVTKASIDPKMKAFYQEAKPYLEKALSNDAYSAAEQIAKTYLRQSGRERKKCGYVQFHSGIGREVIQKP